VVKRRHQAIDDLRVASARRYAALAIRGRDHVVDLLAVPLQVTLELREQCIGHGLQNELSVRGALGLRLGHGIMDREV
jgi:hypothetical protein